MGHSCTCFNRHFKVAGTFEKNNYLSNREEESTKEKLAALKILSFYKTYKSRKGKSNIVNSELNEFLELTKSFRSHIKLVNVVIK